MTGTGGIRGKANDGNGFCLAEKIADGIGGRWEVVGEIDFHGRWLDAERWELGAERFCGRCEKEFTTEDTESTRYEKRDRSLLSG